MWEVLSVQDHRPEFELQIEEIRQREEKERQPEKQELPQRQFCSDAGTTSPKELQCEQFLHHIYP